MTVKPYTDSYSVANRAFPGLWIEPDEVEYVASAYTLTVTTPVYSTSCDDPGEYGDKFAITSLTITADKPFNDTLPAGADLSGLFYLWGRDSLRLTDALGSLTFGGTGFTPNPIVIHVRDKPATSDQTYSIQVTITKSDGSTAQGSASGVKLD